MKIIIDGYNLIFCHLHQAEDHRQLKETREQLISLLSHYNTHQGHQITVVFDGDKNNQWPQSQIINSTIQIHFSPADSDADTLITKLVKQDPNPRDLRVVTSDRSLRKILHQAGAKLIYSGEFFKELKEYLHSIKNTSSIKDPPEKFSGIPDHEVDKWMKIFGFSPNTKA